MSKKMLLVAASLMAAVPHPASAWGRTGHATVANIAELSLTPQAKAAVMDLLASDGMNHMADVASWADEYPVVHTTRIPIDSSPVPDHPCAAAKMCADQAITYYLTILKSASASRGERYIALKFVIHLVGDLHQPLHGSDPAGYNEVTFNGASAMRLHAFWDNVIIDQHGVGSAMLARDLLGNGEAVETGGTPRSWAVESSNLARDYIFKDDLPPCYENVQPTCSETPVSLPPDYAYRNYPLVGTRLKQAGLRLAKVLNSALSG